MTGAPAAPALELVTIGNELLLGEIVDRNSAWLGQRLAAAGIRVARRTSVGDEPAAIAAAISEALDRMGTALCTGGLGPTRDDLTKPVVAALFGRELQLDGRLLDQVRQRFAERGLEMPELNRTQALVPAGARVFPNPRGTAPGLALEDERGRLAILLPGVPAEMQTLVEQSVLPFLLERWPERGRPIRHRVLRTAGIPESALAERVDDVVQKLAPISLASLPTVAGVDLRLTSWGVLPAQEAERMLDAAEAELRSRLGRFIYGLGDEDLADAVALECTERGLTLAVAESCTGGLIARRLTDRPGASAFLLAGIVPYANSAKESLLGVQPRTLRDHGAVSGEAVREMAEGARRVSGADAAIAVTGIAGPSGGTPAKPVGLVWLAAAVRDAVRIESHRFLGDRLEIRERAAQAALLTLWRMLRTEVL
ncbi:MAG: competence/damage-inducible protein A [Gemmatimonadetes bacterium]|nr:competence/damage-inducible protein A [Gemmatimonadota bacterium]